ncbi:hypothetical protein IFM89_027473 [Coptis chinensis]|uniref:tRNA synthetases class I catalytic domain-containing protein n=1 Tax=Coptis chinensis TaxID=261450 RepID=A0A835HWT3_9MAGN|nr:hypothetical protein IFM89_027473 [Coptis chinensis]
MYICGVTAYDLSHIGHAHVYVSFDVLFRYLKHLEYEVCYVRNVTDVNDKIIARANELGEDPLSLSRCYFHEFRCDMSYLYCISPSVEPHVSDHMPQIIDMIKQILDNGCAYRVDSDVYFPNMDDYLDGSWKIIEQSTKEGEPFWESLWGPRRPGWHIECSAMSAAYLGYSFDIHGGGVDLVFPHHENEIAFVIDLYHPLAMRLFLMGTHYRSPINYSNRWLLKVHPTVFFTYIRYHYFFQFREVHC